MSSRVSELCEELRAGRGEGAKFRDDPGDMFGDIRTIRPAAQLFHQQLFLTVRRVRNVTGGIRSLSGNPLGDVVTVSIVRSRSGGEQARYFLALSATASVTQIRWGSVSDLVTSL